MVYVCVTLNKYYGVCRLWAFVAISLLGQCAFPSQSSVHACVCAHLLSQLIVWPREQWLLTLSTSYKNNSRLVAVCFLYPVVGLSISITGQSSQFELLNSRHTEIQLLSVNFPMSKLNLNWIRMDEYSRKFINWSNSYKDWFLSGRNLLY